MGLSLADQDRAGGACAAQRLGVGLWHVIGAHRRAVRRSHTLGIEQVLDPQRQTGKRSLRFTAPVGLLARARLGTGALEAERRERAELRVDCSGALGHFLDCLDRRCLAARVPGAQLARGEFQQSCHTTRSSIAFCGAISSQFQ